MKIGLYDSGIGGLSVLKELLPIFPNDQFIYYGDTKNAPYGSKSKEDLWKINTVILNFFESKKIDVLIVACNTSSALFLDKIKKHIDIPVFELIHPTAEKIKYDRFKKVTVFGTNRTIDSHCYKTSIQSLTPKTEVLEIACPLWVPFIETSASIIKNETSIDVDISEKVLQAFEWEADGIIFGCSHYPFLSHHLEKEWSKQSTNRPMKWINPAQALSSLLKKEKETITSVTKSVPRVDFIITKQSALFTSISKEITKNSKFAHSLTII